MSVGLETNDIIEVLNRLSKVPVPKEIVDFIRQRTDSYGKVKLVLKHNRYYVESGHPDTLRMLLKDAVVGAARVGAEDEAAAGAGATENGDATLFEKDKAPKKAGLVIPGTSAAAAGQAGSSASGGSSSLQVPADASATGTEGAQQLTAAQAADQDLFSAVIGLAKGQGSDIYEGFLAYDLFRGRAGRRRRCALF